METIVWTCYSCGIVYDPNNIKLDWAVVFKPEVRYYCKPCWEWKKE